ncbi:MAG: Leucyl aminopeptidase, partial [Nocardioidaceae bacterium]|nr:Leucyl aminopeptidase [Nocardioidaceae bacterium]
MTSFSLRTASPAKTRADVVVVGVVVAKKGGPRVASGGEDVAAAYGRRFAPLLAAMGVSGKAGESVRVPTSGVLKAPTLLLVGLG